MRKLEITLATGSPFNPRPLGCSCGCGCAGGAGAGGGEGAKLSRNNVLLAPEQKAPAVPLLGGELCKIHWS